TCKRWCEQIAALYTERYGVDTVGLRPTSITGLARGTIRSHPHGLAQVPTDVSNDIALLPELAARGDPIEMPPDDRVLDWIYEVDAAEAWFLALMADAPEHRLFNLTAGRCRAGEITAALRRLLPDARITVGDNPGPPLVLV